MHTIHVVIYHKDDLYTWYNFLNLFYIKKWFFRIIIY